MTKNSFFQWIFGWFFRRIQERKEAEQEEKAQTEHKVASAMMDMFGSDLKEWQKSLPEYDAHGKREYKWAEASYLIYEQTGITVTPSEFHDYVRTLIKEKWASTHVDGW